MPPPGLAHTESPPSCLAGPSGKDGTKGHSAPGIETCPGFGRHIVSRSTPKSTPAPSTADPEGDTKCQWEPRGLLRQFPPRLSRVSSVIRHGSSLCLPPSSSPLHALSSGVTLSLHSVLSSFTLLLLPGTSASLPSRSLSPPLPPPASPARFFCKPQS